MLVLAADVQDRDAGLDLLCLMRATCSKVRLIWADGGYAGKLVDVVRRRLGVTGSCIEAVGVIRRTLAEYEEILGLDHPYTLICANNLGSYRRSQGAADEASSLAQRALQGLAAVLGSNHLYTCIAAANLANCHADAKDLELGAWVGNGQAAG